MARKLTVQTACHRNEQIVIAFKIGNAAKDLVRVSTVTDCYDKVVRANHAEIPVCPLGRVHVEGRGPRAGKGRSDFSGDNAMLPHPGEYNPSFACQNSFNSGVEWLTNSFSESE
jgi:hypothetical protein